MKTVTDYITVRVATQDFKIVREPDLTIPLQICQTAVPPIPHEILDNKS